MDGLTPIAGRSTSSRKSPRGIGLWLARRRRVRRAARRPVLHGRSISKGGYGDSSRVSEQRECGPIMTARIPNVSNALRFETTVGPPQRLHVNAPPTPSPSPHMPLSSGRPWDRTGRDNPLRGLPGYRCDPVEVAVVVQHGDVVPLRDSCDEQVGDSGGAVPGCTGQFVLHMQRSVPVGLADVEALKSCPLEPHRVVLARRPAAVENLQVDHRAGRHQTTLDQWGQLREDDRLVQTRVRALVSDERRYLSLIRISEPTRLLSISYAVFCLKKKKNSKTKNQDY